MESEKEQKVWESVSRAMTKNAEISEIEFQRDSLSVQLVHAGIQIAAFGFEIFVIYSVVNAYGKHKILRHRWQLSGSYDACVLWVRQNIVGLMCTIRKEFTIALKSLFLNG